MELSKRLVGVLAESTITSVWSKRDSFRLSAMISIAHIVGSKSAVVRAFPAVVSAFEITLTQPYILGVDIENENTRNLFKKVLSLSLVLGITSDCIDENDSDKIP